VYVSECVVLICCAECIVILPLTDCCTSRRLLVVLCVIIRRKRAQSTPTVYDCDVCGRLNINVLCYSTPTSDAGAQNCTICDVD
jgi:hypothetical protein